jgi:hypothetical protein
MLPGNKRVCAPQLATTPTVDLAQLSLVYCSGRGVVKTFHPKRHVVQRETRSGAGLEGKCHKFNESGLLQQGCRRGHSEAPLCIVTHCETITSDIR